MSYDCEMLDLPARPVLMVRTRTAVDGLQAALGEGYKSVALYLAETGDAPAGPAYVGYYNMDMQDLDIEIGFPVAKAYPGRDQVRYAEIPAGKYAACLYTGPYQEMPPAYEALTKWVEEHSLETTGVVYEHYLNEPDKTPPEALQTLIQFQLK